AAGDRARANPFFSQALQAQQAGRMFTAVEAYKKAAELDPAFFEAQYNLGLAAYALKDYKQALSAFERALSINPTAPDTRYSFALALHKSNYARDAADELEKVLASNPNDGRAHFTLANIYAQQLQEPGRARAHYQRLLELEPTHPQATAIRDWLVRHP
ncbi:MAG: tetratricopeptide repeat protein, partial [Verrucomicrobiota bacterium]